MENRVPLRAVLPAFDHQVELAVLDGAARGDATYAGGWRWMGANGREIAEMLHRTKIVDGKTILGLPVRQVSTEVIDKKLHGNTAFAERSVYVRVAVVFAGEGR